MQGAKSINSRLRLVGVTTAALVAATSTASAGGFALNEQSTVFMGSASAGAAAGGSLGSMYWNPAATAAFPGLNTESSYILVLPQATATVTGITTPGGFTPIPPGTPGSSSGNVGIDAALRAATYGTYQVSKDFWLGMAINSPFGTGDETREYDLRWVNSWPDHQIDHDRRQSDVRVSDRARRDDRRRRSDRLGSGQVAIR